MALDADIAGQTAISTSGEMIDNIMPVLSSDKIFGSVMDFLDTEVKVIILPPGKDLDDTIKEGASQWQELITNAKPLIEFIFNTQINKIDPSDANDKSAVVEKLLPLITHIKDPIRQGHYAQRLAHLLNIDKHFVEDALKKFSIKEKKQRANRNANLSPKSSISYSSDALEEYCLGLLLQYDALRQKGMNMPVDYFVYNENREIFLKWQKYNNINLLKDNLDIILHPYLDSLLTKFYPPLIKESEVEQRKTLDNCTIRLHEKMLKQLEIKKGGILAATAETDGQIAELVKLKEQGIEESRQLRDVFIKQKHHK